MCGVLQSGSVDDDTYGQALLGGRDALSRLVTCKPTDPPGKRHETTCTHQRCSGQFCGENYPCLCSNLNVIQAAVDERYLISKIEQFEERNISLV